MSKLNDIDVKYLVSLRIVFLNKRQADDKKEMSSNR